MEKIFKLLIVGGLCAFILGTLNGCYYDVEEVLYPTNNCDSTATFMGTVLPIFENNCNQCHGTGISNGGVTLDTYIGVKAVVDNNRILGAIRRESGFSPMPQGQPKLSDCNIAKISSWISEGAENN